MLLRVFAVGVLLSLGAVSHAEASTPPTTEPPPPTTVTTTLPDLLSNDFLPQDRSISDCVSAAPKPGCGSKAHGGWHQYLVAIALVGGLVFVGWRIVAGVRRTPRTT